MSHPVGPLPSAGGSFEKTEYYMKPIKSNIRNSPLLCDARPGASHIEERALVDFFLSPRGTSGERTEESGCPKNEPPHPALPMNRLHFPIRGRRTSATDEDDLKDPIAALSPSSSSFVLRPSMATNSTPTYVPGRTERGSWSQFMSIHWKTSLSMNQNHPPPHPNSERQALEVPA